MIRINSDILKQWYVDYNIEKRTIDGFWKYFNNYRNKEIYDFEDDFGEIDDRLIELNVSKIQFTVTFDNGDFVYAILNIYYNSEYIGLYKSIYTLNGEDADDLIRLEDTNYIKRLVERNNNSIEIAENSLREGIQPELVERITGLKSHIMHDIKNKI